MVRKDYNNIAIIICLNMEKENDTLYRAHLKIILFGNFTLRGNDRRRCSFTCRLQGTNRVISLIIFIDQAGPVQRLLDFRSLVPKARAPFLVCKVVGKELVDMEEDMGSLVLILLLNQLLVLQLLVPVERRTKKSKKL